MRPNLVFTSTNNQSNAEPAQITPTPMQASCGESNMQIGFEASELSESSIERIDEIQERNLIEEKLKLKKLIKSKQSVQRVFSIRGNNLGDQNQSFDQSNPIVMQMTPRGRSSRQKIKLELLVNNESLNASDVRQGGNNRISTPSS